MAESKLFEPWTMEELLPHPFAEEICLKDGKKITTDKSYCSTHNTSVKGKTARLHPPTLQAIVKLLGIYHKQMGGAVGIQMDQEGKVMNYCVELEKGNGRCAVVYNPNNGQFKGSRVMDNTYLKLDQIARRGSAGEEFLLAFAYASVERESVLYDTEFSRNFTLIRENMQAGWKDMEESLRAAYICCDNVFRRLENTFVRQDMRLPFEKSQLENDVVPLLDQITLKSGIYSPNEAVQGEFKLFSNVVKKTVVPISQLKKGYRRNWNLAEGREAKIPRLPEYYEAREGVQEILEMVDKTPARFFMLSGGAGIGKSTDAQMIAQVLGLPYYGFSCGPDTDETELLVTMVPNVKKSLANDMGYPKLEDLMMDPASAVAKMTGEYEDGISPEEAFRKIMQEAFDLGFQKSKAEKDFVMVESTIIEACKGPSVIEIREPTIMKKSAAMAKLNSLFDDSAEIDLINGETVRRHPDTIVILTTNMDYIGCQMFNESALSRMNHVQHREGLTAKEMVERVTKKTGCKETELLRKMAAIIIKISRHLKEYEIQGGVCGYREYESWVWSYLVKKNVIHAVRDSVLSKASMDAEERKEIMDTYIAPYFENAA